VVNRDGKLLFSLLLSDYILVEEGLNFVWFGKLVWGGSCRSSCAVVFENRVADRHALVADVCPRIIARGRDQLGNGVLRLVAERAAQNFFTSGPVFHSAQLLLVTTSSCLVFLGQRGKPEFLAPRLPEYRSPEGRSYNLTGLVDDIVNDSVFLCLLRVHDEVPFNVFFDFVQLLPAVLREQLVRDVTHPQDFPRMNVDVRCLA